MDLARAAAFVEADADPLDRARLRVLLHGETVSPEVLPRANDDGGFGSLDATCLMLDRLSDLGDAAATLRARAILFLQARRRRDGWWEEEPAPGDEAATVYVTAYCGYLCDNARAADWLAARVSPDGHLPSFVEAHWLAAALMRRHAQPAAFPLVRHLAGRVGELGPGDLAWLASTLPDEPVGAVARMLLSGRQEPDGRWRSEDGEAFDAAVTLAAIRVLSP